MMNPTNSARFGDTIVAWLEQLAALTDEPGKLTRLYLGPAHGRAIAQVSDWMSASGMVVRLDAAANIVGRYEGARADAPTLLIGSHIDTVRNAGRFDGTLGVLTAVAVVAKLNSERKRLPFAIEVVAFGDEEGVRFASTLTGARALAGRFDPKTLDEVDRDGVSRRAGLKTLGCDVARISAEARDPAQTLGYLEVHIEQGPVLEHENLPVAVVTAINGASRGKVTVTGVAGHAGTVPMHLRQDAIAAAAEMVLAVERIATGTPELVATVGTVEIADSAVNAVPGLATFSLDVRSPSDAARQAAVAALRTTFAEIARRRSVTVGMSMTYDAPAAACDVRLTAALSRAIEHGGYPLRHLASGAGHDAMAFKDVIPFAMLFVRCRGGISHNPAEFATLEDIDIAANVLSDCLAHLTVPLV
jgi:allantoate deiminase